MRKIVLSSMTVVAALAAALQATPAMAGTTTGADLQISGSSSLGSPVQGQPYTYTWQVKNSGPQDATSVTFTSDMTAGSVVWAQVQSPYFAINCTLTDDAVGGKLVSCPMFTIAKGSQLNVVESVTAPTTIGSYPTTGTVTSALVDPQPSNNSFTVTTKVGSSACPLPAGQPTTTGTVGPIQFASFGFVSQFRLSGTDGIQYTVLVNDFDLTAPLTSTINLLCKVVPVNLYIQQFTTDKVTGPVDMEVLPGDTVATPVIHALVVQTPYWTDKVA